MTIGIDIRVLQTPLWNKGIGVYTYNLVKNILRISSDDIFLYLFENEPVPSFDSSTSLNPSNPTIVKLPRYKRHNWFYQQFLRFQVDCDVFHIPMVLGPSREIVLPYFPPSRTVVTIHDLILLHLDNPWSVYLRNTKDFKIQMKSVKKAKYILSVSEWNKADILRELNVSPMKVIVTYLGMDNTIFRPSNSEIANKQDKKIILAENGNYKKNIKTVVEVIHRLKDTATLIIIGTKNSMDKEIVELIDKYKITVKFTGELFPKEVAKLYQNASLLLFPSLYESFGLPIIEAFASRCPVITSNISAPPEIAGDAAILVNPTDVEEITEKTEAVLNNEELRKSLIAKGLKRAKEFTWQKCAEETLRVYREVVSSE